MGFLFRKHKGSNNNCNRTAEMELSVSVQATISELYQLLQFLNRLVQELSDSLAEYKQNSKTK